jgi:2-amino-4-hydroxy-6-hydroxymethyldihydropteridine diphosphokinase
MNDPSVQLSEAIKRLKTLVLVEQVSSFYSTEPIEFREQPWFANCSLELRTALDPRALMDALLRIERDMGRTRTQPKGPRIIDIDLLLFNDDVINEPDLQVPHPAMAQRRFVLVPLAEIAPGAWHPVSHKTASDLLKALGDGGGVVRKLDISWTV